MTYLDIASRGKNSLWRYIVAWPLAILVWLSLMIAIFLPLIISHLVPLDALRPQNAGDHPVLFFTFLGSSFAGHIAGFTLAVFLLHRKTFRDLCGNWHWRHAETGALVCLVIMILSTAVDWALAPEGFTGTIETLNPAIILTTIVCLAIQTFAEEFIFRGYLTQSLLLATRRPMIAAAISALVFGSLHIPNSIPSAINATALGFVLSLIAIRTGGLAFGWGLHFANNLFGAIIVVSANDVFKGIPAIITQNTPDLMWWDTVMGVGVTAVLALLILKDGRFIGSATRYPK